MSSNLYDAAGMKDRSRIGLEKLRLGHFSCFRALFCHCCQIAAVFTLVFIVERAAKKSAAPAQYYSPSWDFPA